MRSPAHFITCYEQYSYYAYNNAFYQIHSLMFNMLVVWPESDHIYVKSAYTPVFADMQNS